MESTSEKGSNLENGNHFLVLLQTETARLNALVRAAEMELEMDEMIPEDAAGKLRIAVGKAKMLLSRKLQQFEELCFRNLGKDSKIRYPVTTEDLSGYWDTIVIQLMQVYKFFEEVDVLRKNNWEDPNINTNNSIREKKKKTKLDKVVMGEAVINSNVNSQVV